MDEALLSAFREDAASALGAMRRLEQTWPHIGAVHAEAHLLEAFRIFHNLKGAADVLGLAAMHALAHAAEECLRTHFVERRKPDVDVIGDLLRAIETMIEHAEGDVTATGLDMIAMSLTDAAPHDGGPQDRSRSLEARLSVPAPAARSAETPPRDERPARRLGDVVPISDALRSYRFIVARTAETLGKEAELHAELGDVTVTRATLAALREPMMHLLRNAVDHGIESAHERARRDKRARGTITLRAERRPFGVEITVRDDGRGLDGTAVSRALAARAAAHGRTSMIERLFEPGVSSRTTVGRVSGRGIGLDAARARLASIRGTLDAFEDEDGSLVFRIVLPHGTEASQDETDL